LSYSAFTISIYICSKSFQISGKYVHTCTKRQKSKQKETQSGNEAGEDTGTQSGMRQRGRLTIEKQMG
jgi:hypothetical protein